METILGLIFSYSVFITRTWAVTRLAVLVDVVLALLYDFTPLRLRFGPLLTIALSATFLLWIANLLIDRQRHAELAEAPPESSR